MSNAPRTLHKVILYDNEYMGLKGTHLKCFLLRPREIVTRSWADPVPNRVRHPERREQDARDTLGALGDYADLACVGILHRVNYLALGNQTMLLSTFSA